MKKKVFGLASLAAYQEGAIVSREIARNQAGTVTFFAFAAGQGLSEHTAPFDALVQVLDGEAEITIAGELFKVNAGEMLIMPANESHSLMAAKPFKMLLTMLKA